MRLHVLAACAILPLTSCALVPYKDAAKRPIVPVITLDADAGVSVAQAQPVRPVAPSASSQAVAVGGTAFFAIPIDSESQPLPRIDCREKLSQEDDLARSMIEQRMNEGSNYAAYAQVQALPSNVASVALLRADILRRLGLPEAARWYQALLMTCMAGQANHGLGLMAVQRQDYELARQYLVEAVRLQPARASAHNDLGLVYLFLRQDRQAEFELRTASELVPGDRQSSLNLALLALVRGDAAVWWGWRERLVLGDNERASLDAMCRQVSQRRGAATCPINPAL